MSKPVTLRFVFAGHDGLTVEHTTDLSALVKDVKTQLLNAWPDSLAKVSRSENVRLVCMGHGILQDSKTLEACRVPIFPTHPTPVNVAVRPESAPPLNSEVGTAQKAGRSGGSRNPCLCIIV